MTRERGGGGGRVSPAAARSAPRARGGGAAGAAVEVRSHSLSQHSTLQPLRAYLRGFIGANGMYHPPRCELHRTGRRTPLNLAQGCGVWSQRCLALRKQVTRERLFFALARVGVRAEAVRLARTQPQPRTAGMDGRRAGRLSARACLQQAGAPAEGADRPKFEAALVWLCWSREGSPRGQCAVGRTMTAIWVAHVRRVEAAGGAGRGARPLRFAPA